MIYNALGKNVLNLSATPFALELSPEKGEESKTQLAATTYLKPMVNVPIGIDIKPSIVDNSS